MRRHLPSLTALQCLEASARHLSFTKAAEELCMTQGAVSRQIKKLEIFLGCTLFGRVHQRVMLTPAGETYARGVRKLLDEAEVLTRQVSLGQATIIKVAAEPAIASRWLIPRLANFKDQYPEIEIELVTDLEHVYGEIKNYDVAILFGDGNWPGLDASFLMSDELVAVAAPSLLEGKSAVSSYADVIGWPLLHHTARLSASREWLRQSGIADEDIQSMPGQRFEHFHLLLQAALQELGVAILPDYFAKEEIENGRLVYACDKALLSEGGYYVGVPKEKRELYKVDCFSGWLIDQGS